MDFWFFRLVCGLASSASKLLMIWVEFRPELSPSMLEPADPNDVIVRSVA